MANSYTTHRRQLYMLPTKAGWVFTGMVFLLFLASIKFSHQATFLLTFLLCGFAMISSLHTQKNINNLALKLKSSPAVFAQENAEFICRITNSSDAKRHNVWLVCGEQSYLSNIEADSTTKLILKLPTRQRGIFTLPAVTITSHYPLGILFGWSKAFKSDMTCLVFPQPKDLLKEPGSSFVESNEGEQQALSPWPSQGGEQISSLKAYQQGDRLRDIHWPSLAKSGQLVSKEYDSSAEFKLVFTWKQVDKLNLEDKLSQLTFWILAAEKRQMNYQLFIPGFDSDYGQGPQQLNKCLEKLALWDSEENHQDA